MTVIFRPHCGDCGYEFEEVLATSDEKPPFGPVFEPCCCPKCKAPIKGVVYCTFTNDKKSLQYRKEVADNYAKEFKEKYETR